MDYDEKCSRLSDKIRRVEIPKTHEQPVYVWSLSEAMDIGASFLAFMEEKEREIATSKVISK